MRDASPIPMWARLEHWRDRTPTAIAVREGDTEWTVAELLYHAEDTAAWLRTAGVRAGDRVAWHGPSSLDFARVLLATWRVDATYVGINPRYTAREMQEVTDRTSPRVVLTADRLRDARGAIMLPHARAPLPPARGDQPAVLVFTTGSTGRPKVVVLSHRALAAAASAQAEHTASAARCTINALPANHIGSIANITTATWWGEEAVDFVPVFSAAAVVDRLRRSSHVRLAAVPTLFSRCLEDASFADAARGRLVHALSGGAPLPRAVYEALRALDVTVQGMYGQSEVSGSVCYTAFDDDAETTCHTVGRAACGVTLRLGPLDGSPGSLDAGELQVQSDQCFDGYLDDTDATQAAFTSDGWLRTGDLADRRADGAVRLTGRLKEIINTGGHKVMPREVESVLQACAQVASATVIATPDDTFGELVSAVIVTRDGIAMDVAALEVSCRAQLANYKVPKRWMQVESMPLLGVGKVDRRALVHLFAGRDHV